jgi:hypothetical protein
VIPDWSASVVDVNLLLLFNEDGCKVQCFWIGPTQQPVPPSSRPYLRVKEPAFGLLDKLVEKG